MATCPNKNLESWQNLVVSRGDDIAHYLWDKYNGLVPESESKQSVVKAGLKAVNALQTDKAVTLFSALDRNKVTGDRFWNKVQADLQIPKEQIELLKQYNTTNREELVANMLGDYSFAIEINIARTNYLDPLNSEEVLQGFSKYGVRLDDFIDADIQNGVSAEQIIEDIRKNFISSDGEWMYFNRNTEYTPEFPGDYGPEPITTKEEVYKLIDKERSKEKKESTQYYSNLTVPGGTNYTENEIATPAITPNIKGHAQFATDKGIGWFRSDDKAQDNIVLENEIKKEYEQSGLNISYEQYKLVKGVEKGGIVESSKTRRILEVQSDLFQKGRETEDLIGREDSRLYVLTTGVRRGTYIIYDPEYSPENVFTSKEQAEKELERLNAPIIEARRIRKEKIKQPNQFLQLLNKGNNWVTFFVKSIIQDSAKKGYNKVLFPKGDTASKIEGHTTLTEFKKQKEDRIKELEKEKKNLEEGKPSYEIDEDGAYIALESTDIDSLNNEINQLKQELERVEREGFGALRPIYNFYETTVANVLKKQGYSPKVVTDEYGNQWNEVSLDKERDTQKILFQLRGGTVTSTASPQTIKMIKDFLGRIGVNIKGVDNIVVNGVKMDANAAAIVTQKLIQVVNGMESRALPEEAMHFAVEIIKQTNPKLYQRLLSEINSYQVLKDTFADYSNNPLYQLPDGKPNVLKIKDEAIAKVLTETVIFQNERSTDSAEKLAKVQTWWQQILEWLKGLFSRSGFDQAAMDIIAGKEIGTADDIRASEDEVFLQESKQLQMFNTIKRGSMTVEKRGDGYYVDGKKVPRRVTDLVNDWYQRRFDEKKLTDTEFQKAIDAMKADKGTAGHADMEYAFNVFVDAQTGLMRPEPLDDSGYISQLNKDDRKYYVTLRDNLRKRLESFGPNARFLAETVIYDPKRPGGAIAGTVDFMAITEDGRVNILDWKFTNLNTNKYEDIPWYKVNAWRTQMNQYKLILKTAYGIKEDQFDQTRMIPIQAIYTEPDYKKEILPRLSGIRIGDVNIRNIQEDYLLPVGLEEEATGEEELDDLLAKLNRIYKRMSEKKVTPGEKLTKAEQLNSLYTAIRHLQMRRDAKSLVYQARVINKQINDTFDKFANKFEGKDPKSFTEEERSKFTKEIDDGLEALGTYAELSTDLDFLFRGELSKDAQEVKTDIDKASAEAKLLRAKLLRLDKKFTSEFIARSEGIEGSEKGEKSVRGASKWFNSTATLQIKSAHVLFRKSDRAFTYAGMDVAEQNRKLMELKKAYDIWAKGKGLKASNYFDIIRKKADSYQKAAEARKKAELDDLNKIKSEISAESYKQELGKIEDRYENAIRDKNQLIDEFDPEFYSKLRTAVDQKNYKWIRENVDRTAYAEYLRKKLDEEEQRIYDKTRIGTEEGVAADIKREIANAKNLYNISTEQSLGWLLYDDVKQFPNRDTWESKEWKELNKKDASGKFVNQPAIDFYNYIRDLNAKFAEIGYINAKQSRVFLPWVRKGLTEKIALGGKLSVGEQFLRNISIDEGDTGYGQRDPITGKLIEKIPIYFTQEFVSADVSTDLFRTIALYNEFATRYKYLSEIEDQALAMLRLERNKRSIATSWWGQTEYKNDEIQYNPDNSENAQIIEDMTKAIIYQQKFIQSDTFDQVLGKIGNVGERINKKLGFKLMPEGLAGRQISLNKSIDALNQTFQLQALGLNMMSSMSNLFGGTTQSIINSGKYFTRTDFVKAEAFLFWNKLGQKSGMPSEIAKKYIGAMDYFMPYTGNYNRDMAKKLSLSRLSQESIQDWLMFMMRYSDRAVQGANFFAFLENTIVVGNEVVNAREYLRNQPEYLNKMYEGTKEERKARAEKFEKDVQKLIEEKGVLNVGKIEGDVFVIPGVEQKSESIVTLRRLVQQLTADALGNMSEANRRLINLNIYSNSFMVFKNWIPRLVDVRFGNLKYNSASDAYEWGRMRTLFRFVTTDVIGALNSLKSSIMGNDEVFIQQIRALYEKKKADYERDTGKTLEMTIDQFTDLVRANIRNQALDAVIFVTLLAIYFGLKANMPDDDEDPAVRNRWKYMLRMTDKLSDEIAYFYNPTNIFNLVSQGVFPSLGLIDNYKKTLKNFAIEMYGLSIGDEELVEENQVIKYLMKSFPITSQGAQLLPMFSPELAKDLGIRMPAQSGIR